MSKTPPLPAGFRVELDSWTRQLTEELWFGGSPVRIVRLTPAGQAAWRELQPGRVTSRATGVLARYLTDTGLAHPVPPTARVTPAVTAIVPVRDRTDLLARCLTAIGRDLQVVVIDDASRDPATVAQIAARLGAKLIRREVNGGPAAARNTGLAALASEGATCDLVAFVDSDCEPSPDWIARLAGHFADPLVAVVAPRITGRAASTAAGRYTEANGALDLGGRPARVMPKSAVSYVPTAAVLARREALLNVARDSRVFDETLRVGEDVDLVWRLHEAGWRIRYDPSVHVAHHEPATWAELLARRYRYGTSTAPLARRHPGDIVHLALQPWPALTVAALLARRPVLAAAAFGGALVSTGYRLHRADVPRAGLTRATAAATRQTWLGLGRYATQFAAPLLVAGIAMPSRGDSRGHRQGLTRSWGRRAAAASLLLGPSLTAWARSPRSLDPVRFTLGRIADDIAYGLGVWSGCVAERTFEPLRPVIAWRPLRIDPLGGKPRKEPRS
ncbi:MAG TPA: mycofactocin biosynthesis glycosyltransferase MftF [Streptosporangiaceae bacterium]|nr:mycofactocin biosynthesis glycosyltransferase MftF [Streptosporangiaceae bacterium]